MPTVPLFKHGSTVPLLRVSGGSPSLDSGGEECCCPPACCNSGDTWFGQPPPVEVHVTFGTFTNAVCDNCGILSGTTIIIAANNLLGPCTGVNNHFPSVHGCTPPPGRSECPTAPNAITFTYNCTTGKYQILLGGNAISDDLTGQVPFCNNPVTGTVTTLCTDGTLIYRDTSGAGHGTAGTYSFSILAGGGGCCNYPDPISATFYT